MKRIIPLISVLMLCLLASTANAIDKYKNGGGNWDTTTANWGLTPGGPYDQLWVNGDNAILEGAGGTLTLGTITAGTVTFTNFTGTYTLNSGSLAQSGGITVATNAGTISISSGVSGAGGVTKLNPDIMTLRSGNKTYTGPTVVSDGILQLGTGWGDSSSSIPGGFGGTPGGSHIELNGGNLKIWWPFTRTPGANPEHIRLTSGESGFSFMQYDRGGQINFTGSSSYELVWGSDYFKPDVLVLNEAAANPQQITRIDNKIDLIGTNRTVACNSTRSISAQSGNGYMATAGGRLLGVIQNSAGTPAGLIKIGIGELQLTAANTYDGATQVKNGALSIYSGNNRVPVGSTLILGDSSTDDSATFKLHGYSQTLTNGLLTAGAGTDNRVINGRSTESTLTLDVASGTNTVDCILGGSTANDNNFGLTKNGAGTLSLTASNSYAGATIVAGGELSVTGPYFSDTASVIMGPGTTITLNHSSTDTVHSLVIGETLATAGTWGGPASTAINKTNALAGTGMIYVDGSVPASYWDGPNVGGTGNLASDGGSGIWSVTNANWDRSLGSRVVWGNTTNDIAIIAGSGNNQNYTITLNESVNISQLSFINSGDNNNYTVSGGTMNFSPGGMISVNDNRSWQTINSAITGSPDVETRDEGAGNQYEGIRFSPSSGTVTLGDVLNPNNSGSTDKAGFAMAGSTTGNSVRSINYAGGDRYGTVYCESGEWTVGDIRTGTTRLSGGKLIANGSCVTDYQGFVFTGGTLAGTGVVDDAVSVPASVGTLAPGNPSGTLTITNNNCTINGTLEINVNGTLYGALAVYGTLAISNATLDVVVSASPGQDMIIATYNALGGEFVATNGASGWEVDYSYQGGNAIALIPPALGTVIRIK